MARAGHHVWVAGVVGQAPDGGIPADVVDQFDIAIAVRVGRAISGMTPQGLSDLNA